jgi:uncharacterized repeat protein (TIGR01451 family)
VVKTDLSVDVSRTDDLVANGWFPYTVDVRNEGTGLTVGDTTVSLNLPSDFTYRSQGSGGSGWTCVPSDPQNVVCTRSASIAGNEAAPPITISARVDRNAPAEPRTVTASVATQGDIDAFDGQNTDSDTGTVQILSDLAVDVAATGSYVVGDPGTATYTVTNESVVPGTSPTTLTSSLPGGLAVSALSGAGWDCSATTIGGSEISCVLSAGLNAGETSSPVNVTFAVAQDAYPGVSIPAAISNSEDAFQPNNEDSVDVQARRVDVEIQKLAVRPFNVGIEGRYRLNVTNVGDAATVGDVVVVDELPEGLTLNSVSGAGWDCSGSTIGQRQIRCVLPSELGAGIQAAPIEARVTVLDQAAASGTVVNTAYVDTPRDDRAVPADDAVSGNNSSTVETPAVAVDLAIESSHQGAFLVGTDDLYSLTVRNVGFFGTDPGESVTVTNDLPEGIVPLTDDIEITRPGWTCDETNGDITCTLQAADEFSSAMPAESTVTIDIPVRVTDAAADSSESVAEVSTARDSNPLLSPNNIATDPTTVTRIDLALAGSVSIQPRAGSIGEVTVDVSNVGSATTVSPSIVTIPLATGVAYRPSGSTTAGWQCSSPGPGTSITCVRSQSIAAGVNAPPLKLRLDVSTNAPADWITELSVSTVGEPTERLANNEFELDQTLETIDLTIAKSHDPAAIRSGGRGAFSIRVSNVGNTASASTIRVEDRVHASFENVSATGPGWTCSVTGNNVACTRTASLAAGADAPDITVGFDVPSDVSGTRNSTAEVSSTDDPFSDNDSADDPIQIVASADVAVEIDQPAAVRVGDTVDISYTVRNTGTEATSGSPSVTLNVGATEGLRPISGTGTDGWDCETVEATQGEDGVLRCGLGDPLPSGGASTVTGEFEVVPTSDSFTETLAFVSTPGEFNRSNNLANAQSQMSGVDLETTVAADIEYLSAGTTTERVVNVENVGTAATTAPIDVSVPLPAGLLWDTSVAVDSDWNCSLVSGTIRCRSFNQVAAGDSLPSIVLGLRPSRSNAPSVQLAYSASTAGDENAANDSAVRTDVVRYVPETTISSAPSGTTTSRTASITFSSDDSAATFECQVGAAAFAACQSPLNLTGLTIGDQVVRIRAINEFGMVEETPAAASWTVEPVAFTGPSVPLGMKSTAGSLSLAALGSVDLPPDQVTLSGRLYTDSGGIEIPMEDVSFAPVNQVLEDVLGPGTSANVVISIAATGDGVGSLPNGGGPATFVLPVRADVEAKLGGSSLLPPGTECSLKPITFDLAGTYDEASGTVSLEQTNVAFPQVTGCGSFKGVIDTLLELPRSDIQLALEFAVTKGSAGSPKLAKLKKKGPKSAKAGKTITLQAIVRNSGKAPAAQTEVCVKSPTRFVKGKANRCTTVRNLAAGSSRTVRFKLATKKGRKGKAKFQVSARIKAIGGSSGKKEFVGHVTLLK